MKLHVSIVGMGNVGTAVALALINTENLIHINLVCINEKKAWGEFLDLSDAASHRTNVSLSYEDWNSWEADKNEFKSEWSTTEETQNIVIFCAGVRAAAGESRLNLLGRNLRIAETFATSLEKKSYSGFVFVLSNPVDILTTFLRQKFAENKFISIFGCGSILDTLRLRVHLAEILKCHPANCQALVIGEHGDSSVCVLSQATALGKPLEKYLQIPAARSGIQESVRKKVYDINGSKGFSQYGIAAGMAEMFKAFCQKEPQIFPLSIPVRNKICVGYPCVVSQNDIKPLANFELDETEQRLFQASIDVVESMSQSFLN